MKEIYENALYSAQTWISVYCLIRQTFHMQNTCFYTWRTSDEHGIQDHRHFYPNDNERRGDYIYSYSKYDNVIKPTTVLLCYSNIIIHVLINISFSLQVYAWVYEMNSVAQYRALQ